MYYIVRLNKFQVVVATPSHTCTKYYTSALWIFMKGTCTNIQSFYLLSAVQYTRKGNLSKTNNMAAHAKSEIT